MEGSSERFEPNLGEINPGSSGQTGEVGSDPLLDLLDSELSLAEATGTPAELPFHKFGD